MYYNEIFSLVVRHTSIRVLLKILTREYLEFEKLDVKIVFLHVVCGGELHDSA